MEDCNALYKEGEECVSKKRREAFEIEGVNVEVGLTLQVKCLIWNPIPKQGSSSLRLDVVNNFHMKHPKRHFNSC